MKQKQGSFSKQMGLWLSAAAILVSASSPFNKLNLVSGRDAMSIVPSRGWSDPIGATDSSNDYFASPVIISSLPYTSAAIDTTTYTAGEPQDLDLIACDGDVDVNREAGEHSAWFRYTATTAESIIIDTLASNVGGNTTEYDTMLGVYLDLGSGGLSQVACDDDSAGNLKSVVTVAVSPGSTYYIVASSFNGTPIGGGFASSEKDEVGGQGGDYDPGGNLILHVIDPPFVSSSARAGPNPTTLNPVDFIVTFSEPVTNVDANDFTLTTNGSGVDSAAVVGVTPSSSSVYTVSVSTGTGNGIIRLNVINDSTILDSSFFPLLAGYFVGESYRLKRTPIFDDVPFPYWANDFIERLFYAGVTGGCSVIPLNYCPDSTVTRAQMAVFLLKVIHGSSYSPPDVGASTGFGDVPVGYWADKWIKQLAAEGITGGCGAGVYCPDATVTRAQMAVFLLKSKHGSAYAPPSATGVFTDVPVGYWADKWIEQLAVEGVTSGCGAGIYCPDASVTRAQMAVFLVKAFGLP